MYIRNDVLYTKRIQTNCSLTDTANSRFVEGVSLATFARETSHCVLAPSVTAYAGEFDTLVDVFAIDETRALDRLRKKINKKCYVYICIHCIFLQPR